MEPQVYEQKENWKAKWLKPADILTFQGSQLYPLVRLGIGSWVSSESQTLDSHTRERHVKVLDNAKHSWHAL